MRVLTSKAINTNAERAQTEVTMRRNTSQPTDLLCMAARYFETMSLNDFNCCPMPFLFLPRSSILSKNLSSVELLMHFSAVRVIHSQRLKRENVNPKNVEFIAKLKVSNGAAVEHSALKSQV